MGLLYLSGSTVDLTASRLLFFGSAWLSVVLLTWILAEHDSWKWLGPILLLAALAPIYLVTMGQSVGTADTFEFQVVAPKLGIVHPTGYPLYLILAKLFTSLPLKSVAWRVNFATALFALAAVTVTFWLLWRLQRRPLAALLAALTFGLTPTFWSQAIEAEVYTLHALIVASALLLMREIGGWTLDQDHEETTGSSDASHSSDDTRFLHRLRLLLTQPFGQTVLLAFVLGLGLTNHLTTLILLPAAILTILFAYRQRRYAHTSMRGIKGVVLLLVAFLLPLVLYAYLPLRWQAVNGEPMGFSRFVEWVVGGRFQGALQLTAWLNDTARYGIVGRLLKYEWQPTFLLLLSIVGAIWLFIRTWRYGLILFLTWLGFIFYNLNYYVPDLAVFLLPVVLIMAIWWGIGLGAVFNWLDRFICSSKYTARHPQDGRVATKMITTGVLVTLLLALGLKTVSEHWSSVDASQDDGRPTWAEAVLSLPLDEGSAILADSDKFPPLYYLQQVEGFRPDLDILLLPDEQAYRSELEQRLSAGQQVYLARFLPGLEGIYHLGSEGPLTSVSTQPRMDLPEGATSTDVKIGPLKLLKYTVEPASPYGDGQIAVTFYWSSEEPIDELLQVYVRLVGDSTLEAAPGRHPANNYYPTLAWEPGEIVSDFHLLDVPQGQEGGEFQLEVALAPPFTPGEDLRWTSIAVLDAEPKPPPNLQSLRAQIGPNFLDGITLSSQVRPQTELELIVTGTGPDTEGVTFELRPAGSDTEGIAEESGEAAGIPAAEEAFVLAPQLTTGLEPGLYDIVASYPGQESRCGWLSQKSDACSLGQIEVTGVPLANDSHNFDDRIALTNIRFPGIQIDPGGTFTLNIQWQALADMTEDYTVFVQILDSQDRIVGQVDSWPRQGTYPTSQWQPGEKIDDPYLIQLESDLDPGAYKLHIGFYLLETLQRLSVLNEDGDAVDDKVVVSGLYTP